MTYNTCFCNPAIFKKFLLLLLCCVYVGLEKEMGMGVVVCVVFVCLFCLLEC